MPENLIYSPICLKLDKLPAFSPSYAFVATGLPVPDAAMQDETVCIITLPCRDVKPQCLNVR